MPKCQRPLSHAFPPVFFANTNLSLPHLPQLDTYERQAKKLVRSLASSRDDYPAANDEYVTVESGPHFCFHYVLSAGVCILTLTERAYPKRLAFDYLDELRKEFFQIYGNQVAAASRPYEFIRFDTFIQKTKKVYNDSKTQRNLQKLNSELKDVHSIMTKNINEVISRGERLESTLTNKLLAFRDRLLRASVLEGCVY